MSRINPEEHTLSWYRQALGLREFEMAEAITKMTGVTVSLHAIKQAERRENAPVARKIAEAIAQYLSQEFGRTIEVRDVKHLDTRAVAKSGIKWTGHEYEWMKQFL